MKFKVLIAVILSLAAILFVVAFSMDWMGRSGVPSQAGDQVHSATEDSAAESESSSGGDAVATQSPAPQTPQNEPRGKDPEESTQKNSSAKAEATRPTWNPKPTQTDERLEVPKDPPKTLNALPSAQPREAVLSKTPKTGVAEGRLTKGFPKKAMPLPASTDVERSSVETQGSLVVVGVQGRSKQKVDEVLAFYDAHFKDLQWLSSTSVDSEGNTRLEAGFGKETATITLHQLPTGLTQIDAAAVYTVGD